MVEDDVLINEIFMSIQGESTWVGLPCAFVRLAGCPLRCHYCDTSYAFSGGERTTIEEVLNRLSDMKTMLVEITGGEPLIQPNVHLLAAALLEEGYKVLLETSGERDISVCDSRIHRIVDIKTPNSGAAGSFMESNFDSLGRDDEVKFVIVNREDFDWAIEIVQEQSLPNRVRAVHFSPVVDQVGNDSVEGCCALDPKELSNWIIESGEQVRLHLQIHKHIWSPETRGV
ncbi:MAG: radical SAM protein [Phycisphaerales bacterium]|nr:radical SAM protein [Planctomycetota bacterium]MBL6997760.1 radical SAM protein [Phycisphaerales bacterium]